jgi:hypothetical protein
MKLLKTGIIFFLMAVCFSACEVQGDVVDVVNGTPSNASKVLPHKFKPYDKADSAQALLREENLLPEFKK